MIKVSDIGNLEEYRVATMSETIGDCGEIDVVILIKTHPDVDESFYPSFYGAIRDARERINDAYKHSIVLQDPALPEKKRKERKYIKQIFFSAGLYPIHMKEIYNEGCLDSSCYENPWFIVTSSIGSVKIGRIRGILKIDWSDSDVKADGAILFKGENTTVEKSYIHARSEEQATRFLSKLKEAVCNR